ncbi:MAG: hypothetical protein ACPGUV_01085 [Polyangiales bacterium]
MTRPMYSTTFARTGIQARRWLPWLFPFIVGACDMLEEKSVDSTTNPPADSPTSPTSLTAAAPASPLGGFTFRPANTDFNQLTDVDWDNLPAVEVVGSNGGSITTSDPSAFGFDEDPVELLLEQEDGSSIAVLLVQSLKVPFGKKLRIGGRHPLAIVATDFIELEGPVELQAHGPSSGPGGFSGSRSTSLGAGTVDTGFGGGNIGTSRYGAGGGSYCGRGGGSQGAQGLPGAASGTVYGNEQLIPLIGGSGGGSRGDGMGGGGGGALALVAGNRVVVSKDAYIHAGGGGGRFEDGLMTSSYGGGGGSGGAVLIEAPQVEIAGTIAVNGGGGGGGFMRDGQDALPNAQPAKGGQFELNGEITKGGDGSAAGQTHGETSIDGVGLGSGGGGGGAGRIRINSASGQAEITGVLSPSLDTVCATQGMLTR